MTTPAPSREPPSPQEGETVDKSGPSRKAIIGWGVVMLAVAGFALVSGPVYRAVRLHLVIRRLRRPTVLDAVEGMEGIGRRWGVMDRYGEMMKECTQAACRGNRSAMEVVVDRTVWDLQGRPLTYLGAKKAIAAQPGLFCSVLDERSKEKVLELLDALFGPSTGRYRTGAKGVEHEHRVLIMREGQLAAAGFEKDPVARAASTVVEEYYRHRFARELAQAKKARGF